MTVADLKSYPKEICTLDYKQNCLAITHFIPQNEKLTNLNSQFDIIRNN